MKHAKITLLILCAALFAGCVHEKLEDCFTTINLSYLGDGDTEIFSEKIESVDLYIFDDEDRVIRGYDRYELSPAELAAQSVRVLMPTGRSYHAVAICNMVNGTTLDMNNGNIFEAKILHGLSHPDTGAGDRHVDTQDHLYGGDVEMDIPPTAGSTHTINLTSGHVEMIVEVVGFDEYAAALSRQGASTGLRLEHRGVPKYTLFRGVIPEGEQISQFPSGRRVPEERMYTHEYEVMRNVKGSTLHLYNGEEEIYSLDVESFVQNELMPNPNIPGPYDENGDLLNEAYIPIRIEITDPFDNVGFNVTIPDWVPTEVTPEF